MTAPRIDLVHELVSAAAVQVPDRPAIIGPDGTTTTFAEFDAQIQSVATWVGERTRRGDRVAVVADNGTSYALLYYGVPRAGRVLAMVNQRLGPGERAAQLAAARPTVVLGDGRFLDGLAKTPSVTEVVAFEDPRWRRAVTQPSRRAEPVDPDDPAWLLFTSGSTGPPKGVLHTHRSLTTAARGTVAGRSVRPGGVYLLPFPMCHVAGYNMLVHHLAGATVMPVAAFRAEEFAAAVRAHHVTSCSLAPTMLHSLLAHLEATGTELPTLRDVSYGSAAIPADLLRRALARLDVNFHQGYGMSETGGNVTFLGPADHRAGAGANPSLLATAGRPHDEVEVRISGDGPIGEILVRGAQVAAGYWPGPEPVTVDGWLHTGDVGRLDPEGRLVVVDRIKDVVITGGENVSSREVEDVLSGHPDVDQVAVVGVADDYWGEAICAVVVPRAGSAPTPDDLVAHVRGHLTAFKRPRHVLFVDSLPSTPNGKVAKNAVRAQARRVLGGQAP
ncbi:AMP-binding protein [Mycobacterium yunnanensis]|uniref:Long-chain-fatty-acid--CoA ligase FadD13 n=1 Tax=Mycobacterium yunnanensis TaxID=368477 RepID=A0A9X2YSQ6_9MYCO|nr:AMP-binding protein [Mycobacterium yunnanensis]MCV7424798.1 AMP-binding protein [Mycobacterium yunnanensis]